MSDLLAATGWIGEHPQTGADVAHLLLYPATGIEQDTAAKIATLARLVGAVDAFVATGRLARLDAEVDARRGILRVFQETVALPDGWLGEWAQIAEAAGFVVVTLTDAALPAGGVERIDALLESGARLWVGRARVRV